MWPSKSQSKFCIPLHLIFQTEKCRAFERHKSGADPVHDMAFQKGLLQINASFLFLRTLIQLETENFDDSG